MSKINLGKCCEKIYSNYQRYDCGKPGKIIEDGKVYCGIHNPERARKRNDKYEKEQEITKAKNDLERKIRLIKTELLDLNRLWFNMGGGTIKLMEKIGELIAAERELEVWELRNNK